MPIYRYLNHQKDRQGGRYRSGGGATVQRTIGYVHLRSRRLQGRKRLADQRSQRPASGLSGSARVSPRWAHVGARALGQAVRLAILTLLPHLRPPRLRRSSLRLLAPASAREQSPAHTACAHSEPCVWTRCDCEKSSYLSREQSRHWTVLASLHI
eukprot:SM000017S02794  [mRNA]  locus=s17:283300:283787:+ [translate_table: standard]